MVGRFDADDALLEAAMVLLRVPEKVQLRLRRPDQENAIVTLQGASDAVEIAPLVVGMVPDALVLFVGVAVNVSARRVNARVVNLAASDREDACLFLIHPYDDMFHGGPPPSITKRKPHAGVGPQRGGNRRAKGAGRRRGARNLRGSRAVTVFVMPVYKGRPAG
jgi:hypothetical protein